MGDIVTERIVDRTNVAFGPGEIFGSRYQIIAKLGEGGMGSVFKARDLELDEVVALKMIRPELTTNPDIVKRFKRELQLARGINHDNVIRIHDLGEIDGIKYISMKYVEGETLDRIIRRQGRLGVEQALSIGRQVCLALRAAHAQGIVHRDLKAQNVMIDNRGRAVVIDFGIARSLESPGTTRTGVFLGTPDYISPEQIYGGEATPRTDIYSLGVLLYQMAAGSLPFRGETPAALLQQHLTAEPLPPSRLNPAVPKGLDRLILKCLSKQPEKRYARIDDVLDELEQLDLSSATRKMAGRGPVRKVVRQAPQAAKANPLRRWLPLIGVLAVAEIILVVFLISLLKEDAPAPGDNQDKAITNKGGNDDPKPPMITLFSGSFISEMGGLLIKKFHPLSAPIATRVVQRGPNSLVAETTYQGTYLKAYRHSLVWAIGVDGSMVSVFRVISDTSPFNARLYDQVVPLVQELIKKML